MLSGLNALLFELVTNCTCVQGTQDCVEALKGLTNHTSQAIATFLHRLQCGAEIECSLFIFVQLQGEA